MNADRGDVVHVEVDIDIIGIDFDEYATEIQINKTIRDLKAAILAGIHVDPQSIVIKQLDFIPQPPAPTLFNPWPAVPRLIEKLQDNMTIQHFLGGIPPQPIGSSLNFRMRGHRAPHDEQGIIPELQKAQVSILCVHGERDIICNVSFVMRRSDNFQKVKARLSTLIREGPDPEEYFENVKFYEDITKYINVDNFNPSKLLLVKYTPEQLQRLKERGFLYLGEHVDEVLAEGNQTFEQNAQFEITKRTGGKYFSFILDLKEAAPDPPAGPFPEVQIPQGQDDSILFVPIADGTAMVDFNNERDALHHYYTKESFEKFVKPKNKSPFTMLPIDMKTIVYYTAKLNPSMKPFAVIGDDDMGAGRRSKRKLRKARRTRRTRKEKTRRRKKVRV
jgi:hypothetical protein